KISFLGRQTQIGWEGRQTIFSTRSERAPVWSPLLHNERRNETRPSALPLLLRRRGLGRGGPCCLSALLPVICILCSRLSPPRHELIIWWTLRRSQAIQRRPAWTFPRRAAEGASDWSQAALQLLINTCELI